VCLRLLSYSHKTRIGGGACGPLDVLDIDTWDDRRIEAGADWFEEIQESMARPASPSFSSRPTFWPPIHSRRGDLEAPGASDQRRTAVIPVIVATCAWTK